MPSSSTAPAAVFAALLGAGCFPKGGARSSPPDPPPPPPPPPTVMQTIESAGITLRWAVEDRDLRVEVSAPTTGWVSVGFNTVRAQHLANMVVGWVDAAGPHVEDRYAVDPPYIEPDVQLGGSDDVTLLGGTEADGRTTIEFRIPLDSGDPFDLALAQGQELYVILSCSDTDDPTRLSTVRVAEPITL